MSQPDSSLIQKRVEALRSWMKQRGLAAFVVPSTDAHASEYVPAHWASRAWISGFDGSAGTAVVTLDAAALWTDSRYFLAAAEQLEGTPFCLMKERVAGTPTIAHWLLQTLPPASRVGLDGWVNTGAEVSALADELAVGGMSLCADEDPFAALWTDRPALPLRPVEVQPIEYAGEEMEAKLARLRTALSEAGADAMVVTALDEVAWLTNLRGTDVHCNPVFVAYAMVLPDALHLFIDTGKLTESVKSYLAARSVSLHAYTDLLPFLTSLPACRLLVPPSANARLEAAARSACFDIVEAASPIASMKAVKNEAEVAGFRRAMLRDGVALVRFLRRLRPAVEAGGMTEVGVDRLLTSLRAEQPLFRDISFDTIAGYADHGAIVHYEATPETDRPLRPEGLLLLDSGAQYQDGTTDITRTLALGPTTAEERHVYTLVLKAHISLARLVFPAGSSGTQLDLAARRPLWQEGYNFGHGTGHGVGSYLNVHEGPHQIRMNWMPAPITAGMTVTNEPGLYLAGRFGVRIENILLAVPHLETEFGTFLRFETLTLCPIDTAPIERELLEPAELEWLNTYHRRVRNELLPLLDDEADRRWLIDATQPL